MSIAMIAPQPGQWFNLSSGRVYVADNSGNIANVNPHDIAVLLDAGCTFSSGSSGTLGGDLSGTLSNATVLKIAGQTPGTVITHNSADFDAAGTAQALKATKGGTQSRFFDGVPTLWSRTPVYFNGAETVGGTSRVMFQTASYGLHDVVAVFENFAPATAPESQSTFTSPVTVTAVLEYPANTFYQLKVGGKTPFVIQPGSTIKCDPIGVDIPGNAQFWTRTYAQLAIAPKSPSATAGTGGSLTAGTYFYKLTAICGDQGESGPSTEVSATVSASGTVALNWAYDATTPPQSGVRIYRGSASNSEVLLATLPGWTTSFTDAGGLTPGSATPPTQELLWKVGSIDNTVRSGEGTSLIDDGGSGGNQTLTNGTAWMTVTSNQYVYGPSTIMGVPDIGFDVPVVCLVGDSIMYGTGDHTDRGFAVIQLVSNNIPYFFTPKGGDTMSSFSSAAASSQRILKAGAATDVVCEYGTNDITSGTQTFATLQSNAIAAWTRLAKRALRVWQTTIIPRTTSSDNFATASNQVASGATVTGATNASPIVITSNNFTSPPVMADGTPVIIKGVLGNTAANGNWYAKTTGYSNPTFALYQDAGLTIPVVGNAAYTSGGVHSRSYVEGIRTSFNDWLRQGAPVLISGTTVSPTTNGTTNAVYAGQSGHPLAGYFDTCVPIEVNASNVASQDGGVWISNGTANFYTGEGTHPSTAAHTLMAPTIIVSRFTAP